MQKFLTPFFIIGILLLSLSLPARAADTYILDPNHSYVMWHINHFGFSNPSGKWVAQGTLSLDQKKIQDSKINATINVANIVTGLPELDEHLKDKLFFDVTQFPTATFVSDKVMKTGKDSALVKGTLTLRGISKPVTLHVKLNKIGENPISNKESVGFSATTQLKRSDFGMTSLLPGLSDAVKIDIEIEAFKNT